MTPTKRLRLAVLTLVAAAIFSPPPALAAGAIKLVPTGVEPDAWGQVKWGKGRLVYNGQYGTEYQTDVQVSCKGLTPGETYYAYCLAAQILTPLWWVPVGQPIIANATGAGSAIDTIRYREGSPLTIEVRNTEGVVVLTQ